MTSPIPINQRYEVHSHSFVRGRRSGGHYENGKWTDGTFSHSHEDGHVPHTHPDTGPACYTIDKDEWAARTMLGGGGRKKFTAKPTGEQLPFIARTEEENTFDLIITDSATHGGEIPIGDTALSEIRFPAAERMMARFKMKCNVRDERKRPRRAS